MSIINKVLKDLDKRHQQPGMNDSQGSAVAPLRRSPIGTKLLVLLLFSIVVLAIIYMGGETWLGSENTSDSSRVPENSLEPKSVAEQSVNPQPLATTQQQPSNFQQPAEEDSSQALELPEQIDTAAIARLKEADLVKVELAEPEATKEQDSANENSKGSFTKRSVNLSAAEIAERALRKARDAQSRGLFSDASDYFNDALDAQPDLHEARKEWAALEYGRGQLNKGLSILRDGLEAFPNAHSLRLLAASMLEKTGEAGSAKQLLLQRQPDPNEFKQYYQFMAELGQKLNDTELMRSSYRALVEVEPDKGRWRLGLGLALRETDPQAALQQFERAAQLISNKATLEFIAQQIQQLRSQHETPTP
ncbi:MAG: tetratricopeptide repeat protein [Pseudomonadota bacterium]